MKSQMRLWARMGCAVALLGSPILADSATRTVMLQVYQVDTFDGTQPAEDKLYALRDVATGETFHVDQPPQELTRIAAGTTLELAADWQQGRVESLSEWRELAAAPIELNRGSEANPRSAITMIVDFNDSAVSCSNNAVQDLMWTGNQSVDGLYQESSFGLTSFPPDTDGNGAPDILRVTVNHSVAEECNASGWAASADTEAEAQGIDLSLYQHRVYVLPSGLQCGWAGLGSLGCFSFCRSWVATCGLPDVYAHELGHNLGLHHASEDDDNDGSIDCEYCDRSDIMGIGGVGWRQLNAAHKDQMGWLPEGAFSDVTNVAGQTLVISALETDPQAANYPQVLTFDIPDSNQKYYLSYRVRTGYDANLNNKYPDKTNIHRFSGSGQTLFVAAIGDGEEFSDPATGLTLTQLSHSNAVATVLIEGGCEPSTPSISWTASSLGGQPGEALTFTAQITNNDADNCSATDFNVSSSAPAGWSATPSVSSISIAPGESGSLDLEVNSPAMENDGDFTVSLSVDDGMGSDHDASADATVTLAGSAPLAIQTLAGIWMRKDFGFLTWEVPSQNAVSYRIVRNGQLLMETTRTWFVDTRACSGGSCQYEVFAVDAAGRVSLASNAITLNTGNTRKGADWTQSANSNSTEVCTNFQDDDGDGLSDCADPDCSGVFACSL